MSDGPHRGLPMGRHWQDCAERASNRACPTDQVVEALAHALKREFAQVPIEGVREILEGGKQGSLFASDRIAELERLRETCPGSAAGKTLIDCAVEAVTDGLKGDSANSAALENALESYTRDCFRNVEEHYQREDTQPGANFVRDRLHATRRGCDFKSVAEDLKSGEKPKRPPKRSGVDEGPPL